MPLATQKLSFAVIKILLFDSLYKLAYSMAQLENTNMVAFDLRYILLTGTARKLWKGRMENLYVEIGVKCSLIIKRHDLLLSSLYHFYKFMCSNCENEWLDQPLKTKQLAEGQILLGVWQKLSRNNNEKFNVHLGSSQNNEFNPMQCIHVNSLGKPFLVIFKCSQHLNATWN